MSKIDALNGSITKALLFLMFPIFACGIVQQLTAMADGIIIGQSAGSIGISVIGGSASTTITLFTGLTSGIVTGAMFVTAYYYGAHNNHHLSLSIGVSFLLSLLFGLIATIVYIVMAKSWLNMLKVPDSILIQSTHYLQLYAIGFIPYFVFQMAIGLMRAIGESKRPTRYLLFSFILNITFDYLFTGLMHFSSTGIALAYILTQIISALLVIHGIRDILPNGIRSISFDKHISRRILNIGLPSALISMAYAATNILIQSSINLLGSQMISSYAIFLKIDNFYWITLACLGTAITTFSGQCFGAAKYARICMSIRKGIFIGYLITLSISATFLIFGAQLASLFTSEENIVTSAASILKFMAPCYLAYPCIEVLTQILKCIGKSIQATMITLSCCCGIRICWIWMYALKHLSYQSIMTCYPISWTLTAVVFILYYVIVGRKILNERGTGSVRAVVGQTADR
ncbi:MAG: polysaccharide biosynthesis C-terminal domain-containing protein [Solobacterium sp.]|jgi:putative MATE family efflux protein|nr:polysaccharide biosynthesis C-terminal domain-containing protein [Solobacterium sp.]MCH4265329.1 polysaccharide biosynthesis C-terminal domain-containing protein [Solobacterium sp.]